MGMVVAAVMALLAMAAIALADGGSVDVRVADKTGYAGDQTDDLAIVEYIGDSNVTYGSSGSGIFEAFLRTHASPSETGYNTDLKKSDFEFDEVGGNFTHSILVSEIPVVDCESVDGGPHGARFLLGVVRRRQRQQQNPADAAHRPRNLLLVHAFACAVFVVG